jgi:hypothetical protein
VAVRKSPGTAGIERAMRAAILICVGVVLARVLEIAVRTKSLFGDASRLVDGSSVIVDCVRAGRFSSCNDLGRDVGAFPLMQYIPSVALRAVGVSAETTLRVLTLSSFASLVAVLIVAYYTLRRVAPPLWAPIVTAALLASPLLHYGRSSFGEELAAALILGAVAAVLLDAGPVVVCSLIVLACVTKETNPPFVFVLAAICAVAPQRGTAAHRRRMLSMITIGVVAGIALNAAFNVFRYGSLQNAYYVQSAFENTRPSLILRLFFAEWVSPNGGLLWFWPLAILLVVGTAVMARRAPRWSVQQLAAPLVALLLLGQVLLLATWWQPFGWLAWGPRLVLPMIPALMVAGAAVGAPYATPAMAKLLRSRAFVPIVLVAIAGGMAQVGVLFYPAVTKFFASGADVCSGLSGPTGPGSARYYDCLLRMAWAKHPSMLGLGLDGLTQPRGVVTATALAGAITLLICAARRAASEDMSGEPSEPSSQPGGDPENDEQVVIEEIEGGTADYERVRTRSRSSSLATFPVAFNGSSITISNVRGTL